MELKVVALDGKESGKATLSDDIFGLEPRKDLLQRCVNWQLAKRQRGTHKTKQRGEINRTGKKMYAQKGTGGARHGPQSVSQFRGGGRVFGPVVRSHAHEPAEESARARAASCAVGQGQGRRHHADRQSQREGRQDQGARRDSSASSSWRNALIIDGAEIEANFRSAARNIPNIDVLPVQGINVYDIMRRKTLVLTKAALDALEARFK